MELINGQKITLGTCYYPEHWDKNLWREDLERMKECGIEVVRIAEFAWSKIEPREGEFTYEDVYKRQVYDGSGIRQHSA